MVRELERDYLEFSPGRVGEEIFNRREVANLIWNLFNGKRYNYSTRIYHEVWNLLINRIINNETDNQKQ